MSYTREAKRFSGLRVVYKLMERGSLAYVKIGRTRRIPVQEVERLVRESLVARRQ